jgi:hypothetical protein
MFGAFEFSALQIVAVASIMFGAFAFVVRELTSGI